MVLAALVMLLGFTRQFDVQALPATAMRDILAVDDVYGERRGLQLGLIVAIGSFGTIGLLIALFSFRRAESLGPGCIGGQCGTGDLHDRTHHLAPRH